MVNIVLNGDFINKNILHDNSILLMLILLKLIDHFEKKTPSKHMNNRMIGNLRTRLGYQIK